MNALRTLINARPGRRFTRYHAQVRTPSSYLTVAVGIAVLVLGLLLTLTPGPGFVVLLVGVAILAGQSRRLARAFDRWELHLRRGLRRLSERRQRSRWRV